MILQRTLKQAIYATGTGLHSGKPVNVKFVPAAPNTGIIFKRVDLDPAVMIPATIDNIVDTGYATTLGVGGAIAMTVEHLMSALCGLGIDNLIIEMDNVEVPIMDGSSSPFIFLFQSAGIVEQDVAKKFLKINKTVIVEDKDKWLKLEPFNGLKVSIELDYAHPVIAKGGLVWQLDFSSTSYIKEVSRARTFGFVSELEMMKANNLALGGSLSNAVVFDTDTVVNADGLRYDNECVKHKVLDAVGDLYLSGFQILGAVTGYKSGHTLNHNILKKLFMDYSAYSIIHVDERKHAENMFVKLNPAGAVATA